MPVIRFSGLGERQRPKSQAKASPHIVRMETAVIVGAAIRCEMSECDEERRRSLLAGLSQLAGEGDAGAKLVLEWMMRRCSPR